MLATLTAADGSMIGHWRTAMAWQHHLPDGCARVLDFTGLPLEAALGKGWTDGIHPEDVERGWDTYAKAFDKREPFQMEYRYSRYLAA